MKFRFLVPLLNNTTVVSLPRKRRKTKEERKRKKKEQLARWAGDLAVCFLFKATCFLFRPKHVVSCLSQKFLIRARREFTQFSGRRQLARRAGGLGTCPLCGSFLFFQKPVG